MTPDSAQDQGAQEQHAINDLCTKALDIIHGLVRGNGIHPQSIRIEENAVRFFHFDAFTDIRIDTSTTEKTVPGQQSGTVLKNEQELRQTVQEDTKTFSHSPDVKTAIIEKIKSRPDAGFGHDALTLPLEQFDKDYITHYPCKICETRGHVLCANCKGKGQELCRQKHEKENMV